MEPPRGAVGEGVEKSMAKRKQVVKKLLPVRIDRGKWLTPDTAQNEVGHFDHISALYNGGKMCCLGFAMNQIHGFGIKTLTGVGMPENLGEKLTNINHFGVDFKTWQTYEGKRIPPRLRERIFWDDDPEYRKTAILQSLAETNDNRLMTPTEREAQVKKGFAKLGWKAVFFGRYPKVKKTLKEV